MDIMLVFSKILVVERIYFITFAKKLKRKEYAEEELLFGIGSRFEHLIMYGERKPKNFWICGKRILRKKVFLHLRKKC